MSKKLDTEVEKLEKQLEEQKERIKNLEGLFSGFYSLRQGSMTCLKNKLNEAGYNELEINQGQIIIQNICHGLGVSIISLLPMKEKYEIALYKDGGLYYNYKLGYWDINEFYTEDDVVSEINRLKEEIPHEYNPEDKHMGIDGKVENA